MLVVDAADPEFEESVDVGDDVGLTLDVFGDPVLPAGLAAGEARLRLKSCSDLWSVITLNWAPWR